MNLLLLTLLLTDPLPAEQSTPQDLSVAITPKEGVDLQVIIEFRNQSKKSLKILKPLDGSLHSLLLPRYRLAAEADDGTQLKLNGRDCQFYGLYRDTKWPEDYLVTLRPGGTYSTNVTVAFKVPATDTYRLTFEYSFTYAKPKTWEKWRHVRNPPDILYPKGLWAGTVRSRTVRIKMKKFPPW